MTDTKPDNTSASKGPTPADSPAKQQGAAKSGAAKPKPARRSGLFVLISILLLVILVLAGVAWYQHQAMQQRESVALNQAKQSAQEASAASRQANQALELARQQSVQIEQMQGSLVDAQQHLQSLEQALQMLTDSGTDIALVNDMDHLVSIAHQQLLLGGNVSNAIIALETAQAQLARANRPGLASLQQAINGDVERLRAVSIIDINRLSSRIDELGRLIEKAPLLIPDDAVPELAQRAAVEPSQRPVVASQSSVADPDASWWKRGMSSVAGWTRQTWQTLKQDLGSFISVRRVDDAAALLLSPEQAGSLRDKLRLRLMTAQLALLMKQPDVWQTETRAVVQLLQARYDINSVEGHRALRLALQLADTSIQVELPSVDNSREAIQALREEHARSSHAEAGSQSAPEVAAEAAESDEVGAPSGGPANEPEESGQLNESGQAPSGNTSTEADDSVPGPEADGDPTGPANENNRQDETESPSSGEADLTAGNVRTGAVAHILTSVREGVLSLRSAEAGASDISASTRIDRAKV